jgi:hypothetical protein
MPQQTATVKFKQMANVRYNCTVLHIVLCLNIVFEDRLRALRKNIDWGWLNSWLDFFIG